MKSGGMIVDTSWIYHDSHKIEFRRPFGAVKTASKVALSLNINEKDGVECVLLKYYFNDNYKVIQMEMVKEWDHASRYEVEFQVPSQRGLLWYYFMVIKDGKVYYYGNNEQRTGGIGKIHPVHPKSFQITVWESEFENPSWFQNKIMYHIFIDRFNHADDDRTDSKKEILENPTNMIHKSWYEKPRYVRKPGTLDVVGYDFFGGNIKGIVEKLDYLKSLNVGVIYLSPIFRAVSNHKYDTGDYMTIDPAFGSAESFQELVSEAEKRGIKIILDGVFSHTGDNSVYFNKYKKYDSIGAYNSVESIYYPWYRFIDFPDKYESWWGFKTLPNVNELEDSYMDFIIRSDDSVIKKWMKAGIKGWRLDVADELPDEFIQMIRTAIKSEDKDGILIGEVWEDASNKISYGAKREYILGKGLDSVTNYPFRTIILDFILFKKTAGETCRGFLGLLENYPQNVTYSSMNLLGSHDTERIITALGDANIHSDMTLDEVESYELSDEKMEIAIKRLKVLSLVQFTYPGVPCIYYGDEAGNQGYKDPHNRGPYPWGRENRELLDWYGTITGIRSDYECLRTGEIIFFNTHEDILCYARSTSQGVDVFGKKVEAHTAFVIINRSTVNEYTVSISTSGFVKSNILEDILNDCEEYHSISGMITLDIKPLTGKLLIG